MAHEENSNDHGHHGGGTFGEGVDDSKQVSRTHNMPSPDLGISYPEPQERQYLDTGEALGSGNHEGSRRHPMPGPPKRVENPKPGTGLYGQGHGQDPNRLDPRDRLVDRVKVNEGSHYTLHAIFETIEPFAEDSEARKEIAEELNQAVLDTGVEVRGFYDVSAYHANADLMFWGLADHPDVLQAANHAIINSAIGRHLDRVWNILGAHSTAEFAHLHVPSALDGYGPRDYAAVYPFVRGWDWYFLNEHKRADMLKRHGMSGLEFIDVRVSTFSAFGLSDYEWSITIENDDPMRLLKLMRSTREVEARLHIREDTPMYAGKRMPLSEWIALQP